MMPIGIVLISPPSVAGASSRSGQWWVRLSVTVSVFDLSTIGIAGAHRVSLDIALRTMRDTGADMRDKIQRDVARRARSQRHRMLSVA